MSSGGMGGGFRGSGGGGRQGGRGGAGAQGGRGGNKEQGKRYFFRRRKVCKFCSDKIDYIDIVQIARCISQRGRHRPLAALPAYRHLGLPYGTELEVGELIEARSMLR